MEVRAQPALDCLMPSQVLPRVLFLLALLLVPVAALAQPRLPSDGALYAGTSERGRTLLVSLHLFPPDGAELQLLEAPAGPGEEASAELTLSATYFEHELELEVTTESWSFSADLLTGGGLDSRGGAELFLYDLEPIELQAIGSVLLGGLRLADGSFAVQRWAPFFYSEPWDSVSFDVSLDEVAREGLELRKGLPEPPVGIFTETRMVFLTSFDRHMLSYYTLIDSYTGGAHPNSRRQATTLASDGSGSWGVVAGSCEAAQRLGWECDESVLRLKIIDGLRRQEAAWVEQGEVTRQTEWLLESFVLTPGGVRFLFDPYEVGPYVQGPFEVDIPYDALED